MTDKVIKYERTFSHTDSFIDADGEENFIDESKSFTHTSILPKWLLKDLLDKYEYAPFWTNL
tara:strand:- start:76 stop:261 length:186 start_codon:yes stop_codon:yes gene_type:complete